jgi:hypothetical protein
MPSLSSVPLRRASALGVGLAAALLVPLAPGASAVEAPFVVDAGFRTPESVLHDTAADTYLVSNVGGPTAADELAQDDDGFISRVAPDGRVLDLRWIDGASTRVRLDSPHGMGVSGDTLYAADLTAVRRFDRRTGAPRGAIPIPGTTFLHDLAIGPDGSVYVTDTGLTASPDGTSYVPTGTDAVYQIKRDGTVRTVSAGTGLGNPNGVTVLRDGTLRVTAYDLSGEVYRPVAGGRRADVVTFEGGFLDGLAVTRVGSIITSSGETSVVYRRDRRGVVDSLYEGEIVADLALDSRRHRLLLPLYYANAVRIQPLAP